MATPTLGDVNKQLWEEALTRVLDLSTITVDRNAELEARVAELEVELSVWKQAHSTVLDGAERDKKAHNAQLATLNKQIASSGFLKNQNPLILCVIDGDDHVFSPILISQGQQGGRLAAQELTKGIAEYLAQEDVQVFGRLSFWVTIYFNKRALLHTLLADEICTAEQFETFFTGLSQASPRFLLVDVGPGKDGTNVKIQEYLQTYSRFPQTLRIFFGGAHDTFYLSTLAVLEAEELLGKVVILQGCEEAPEEWRQLALPFMEIDGLFMTHKPFYSQRRPGPVPLVGLNHNITTTGGLISPQSETEPTVSQSSRGSGRSIDPSKPLHKQIPPPCNEHYLMTCSKGAGCKYSHDWILTSEQLDTLARNAKKAPCNYLKNGVDCPYGDRCCWGHICPSGPKCFHLSKGKCWFKGDAMHSTVPTQDM